MGGRQGGQTWDVLHQPQPPACYDSPISFESQVLEKFFSGALKQNFPQNIRDYFQIAYLDKANNWSSPFGMQMIWINPPAPERYSCPTVSQELKLQSNF